MIQFKIIVNKGEAKSHWESTLEQPNAYSPVSKLIDKFEVGFLAAVLNKKIKINSMTKMSFYREDGCLWGGETATVKTEELYKNHRWAVIDRAIVILSHHLKTDDFELDRNNIAYVMVDVPAILEDAGDGE